MQLSLGSLLAQFGQILQNRLFPAIEAEVGALSEKHQQLITTLSLAGIDGHCESSRCGRGRPARDRVALARAFVAKAVFNLPTTQMLIASLHSDAALRRLCGWERQSQIPDKSVFSRAFREFADSELPQRVHEALIRRTQSERLIGHISRDATAIAARERAQKTAATATPKAPKQRRKRGAPKKSEEMTRIERQQDMTLKEMLAELPRHCAVGIKTNSQGRKETWRGYKLHLDVADGQIPISALLTAASLHDSQAAMPLSRITAQRITNLYDVMDAAYDSELLRQNSRKLGHVPLIERNPRGEGLVPMLPHEAARYKERTTVERVNSRLKDEFGGRYVRVRGHAKVMAHLMFGLLALTVNQLLRLPG
jgi:transposase